MLREKTLAQIPGGEENLLKKTDKNKLTLIIEAFSLTVDIPGTEVFWRAEYKHVLSSRHL